MWCDRLNCALPIVRATLVAGALLVAGCSSTSEDQAPKELLKEKGETIDGSQNDLFDAGKRFYIKGLYSISRESFESLKNSYPMGPYAEFAEIKTADSYFTMREYETAALLYENFLKDHPSSSSSAYAMLLAGRSHHLSYRGLGRDPQPLEKSLQFYGQLAVQYPDSPYAVSALDMKQEALQQLIAHQQLVVEFYKNQNAEKAVASRESNIQQEFGPQLGKLQQERAAEAAVRSAAGNGQPVLLSARRGRPLQLQNPGQLTSGKAKGTASRSNGQQQESTANIRLDNCSQDRATFSLGAGVTLDDIEKSLAGQRTLTPHDGVVTLRLSGAAQEHVQRDCFGSGDLSISGSAITIRSSRPATVLTLDRPPRLVMIFE